MRIRATLFVIAFVLLQAGKGRCDEPGRITFSGYEWIVKSSDSMGPGPNRWSPSNVWLDKNGQLHLKISVQNGVWSCGEVQSVKRFGFGRYEFEIAGRIDRLDRNVVLGLFNYPTRDVGEDGTNEIDIEFARWGMEKAPNGNFTVWPGSKEAKNGSSTFEFSLPGEQSRHSFSWSSMQVEYDSRSQSSGGRSGLLHHWTYAPDDSQLRIGQKPEPVLMNLWLFRGNAPTDAKEVEIILKRFRFVAEVK